MLVIASTGRCGTLGLCEALSAFAGATVEHEPQPRLLLEAWLKHVGRDHLTGTLEDRLRFFASRSGQPYGQSFRAVPLLWDIAAAVPAARFVLLVRDPHTYTQSAASRGVLARGDEWDTWRLLPLDVDLSDLTRKERIALHWDVVNQYLLRFLSEHPRRCTMISLEQLTHSVDALLGFAGWAARDARAIVGHLASRPNSGGRAGFPDEAPGTLSNEVEQRIGRTWSQLLGACEAASRWHTGRGPAEGAPRTGTTPKEHDASARPE